jgi:competence protein ComEC
MLTLARLSLLLVVWLAAATLVAAQPSDSLSIYFVDVEGGQATLVVSPTGESMLFDAGWPGFNGRDADRILALSKDAGVSRIDYMVVTHYHLDHVGGVPPLAEQMPIVTYVDHGENLEKSAGTAKLYDAYLAVRKEGKHLQVKPGDRIPFRGVNVQVVASAGEFIRRPLPGGSATGNDLCSSAQKKAEDTSENGKSIGVILEFGKFRFANLGDLTWNGELELACPGNLLGTVDVYLTTHHGLDQSNAPQIVHALKPRVAVMNNGAKKGGSPPAWQVVRSSPGLEDFWQLHYSLAGGESHNSDEKFIANLGENDMGDWIKLTAKKDGSFTVTNSRNGFTRTYSAK